MGIYIKQAAAKIFLPPPVLFRLFCVFRIINTIVLYMEGLL